MYLETIRTITMNLETLIMKHFKQSRSSLYAEYTSCVGPWNTRGPPTLKDDFILVSF